MPTDRNAAALSAVLDRASVLKRLGGDVELMDQIIQIFIEDAPPLIHSARQALADRDAPSLRRSAHSLKGLMATLSAHAGTAAASHLEQCAARGELDAASPLIHSCGAHVADVVRALQSYLDGPS